MSCNTDTVVARTIGIDTGKNTLHLIGLDDEGTIVLREKLSRSRIASRLANVPRCRKQTLDGRAAAKLIPTPETRPTSLCVPKT